MTKRTVQFAFILAALAISACDSSISRKIYPKELQEHVSFLSSDELKGRMTGTEGDSLAAVYIRDRLLEAGLEAMTHDGFQPIEVSDLVTAGERTFLSAGGRYFNPVADISPFAFSGTSELGAAEYF